MKIIASTAGLCLLMLGTVADAATCRSNLQASTPADRFDSTSEIVSDKQTTLSWMRCAIGQQWTGSTCSGQAKTMSWSAAMALVEQVNKQGYAGHNDWRLPMVPELASIVERQCFNPRMNETVFPGAASAVFWSSMEKRGTADLAYTLDFSEGAAMATLKDTNGAVRLVRGGPWWEPPKMMSAR